MKTINPHEIIRIFVNKSIVPHKKRGRGRPGYPLIAIARLFVYAVLIRCLTDKGIVRHLLKRPYVVKALGLKRVPHRTTIGRWRRRHYRMMYVVFESVANMLVTFIPTKLLIVDSTPLEDHKDSDARWGVTTRGFFLGFKVHTSVNQLGLPLRCKITPGNQHDSPHLPDLLVKSFMTLGDAGYDSRSNRYACRCIGSRPIFARNPRRSGKHYKTPIVLKRFRYLVEQFNSLLKEILQEVWKRYSSLGAKECVVVSAMTAILVVALHAILTEDFTLIRQVSTFWM